MLSFKEFVKIEEAFNNPKYTWRTIRGIAKETGFSEEDVLRAINAYGEKIIKSSSKNTKGEDLYASRENYRSNVSTIDRLMVAIKNRAG